MRLHLTALSRQRRSHSRRFTTAAMLSVLLAAPALAVVGPAQAIDGTRVGPVDPLQRGFPAYYTDDAGVALQMCDDRSANCLLARPRDLAPPEGEALYWAAFAELTGPGIDLSVEFAVEAAWLDGRQVVFDRLRVRGHVTRDGTYTLVHPYGTVRIASDPEEEDRNINFTEDIGCEPAPGERCDFAALAGPRGHITTWLRSTQAQGRYLGDGETPTTVTGGERQFMTITGPSGVASTNRFAVLGKLANARAVSLQRSLDFGNTPRGGRERVRLLNIGTEPLGLGRVSLRGDRTLRRFATGNACRGSTVLKVGRACSVGVRYRPDGRKRSGATLRIRDDTPAGVRAVRVRAMTAAVLRARDHYRFRARRADTSSRTKRIVVTNTGAIPMKIRRVTLDGRNPRHFDMRSGTPRVCARGTRVPVGGQCGVYVGFEPRRFGPKRAKVVLRTNAVRTPHRIRLSGNAR